MARDQAQSDDYSPGESLQFGNNLKEVISSIPQAYYVINPISEDFDSVIDHSNLPSWQLAL